MLIVQACNDEAEMVVLDTVELTSCEPSKKPLPSKNTDIIFLLINGYKIVLIFARGE
uniref:Uncharacterized protein n=1 Tax=viral metagenome TaxID=1070528 RepID=A0A6C0DW71_9ZZZZ